MGMSVKRRALGRGLEALIPAPEPRQDAIASVAPIHSIRPNPKQPRQKFADAAIEELTESIRRRGILQPLLVRRDGDHGYELIAGERRLRAAQRAGVDSVPIVIHEVSDAEMLEVALIENLQREDLSPIEEAIGYQRMIDEFAHTQEEVAKRVGKDRSTVANAVRLLALPAAIQDEIESGSLSAGHARALLAAKSEVHKLELAKRVVSEKLTVRQTERLAKKAVQPLADAEQRATEERLTQSLGTRVRILPRRNGAGRIEIEYYSLEELNGLVDRLGGAAEAPLG
jgi:ParB family chromosome partitioning protein